MAKKAKSSSKKPSKAAKKLSKKAISELIGNFGPLDLLEAFEQAPSRLRRRGKQTPLEKAQDLVRKAQQCEYYDDQIELIQKALEACPDCSEAFLMLGQMAPSDRESIPLFEEALKAAERVLGKEGFEGASGHFWLIHETRPYMEARLELARSLWLTGQGTAAVDHLVEMLRLNPEDNQGLRYLLVPWLIELNRDAEALEWIGQFDEESTFWAFNQALCEFRRAGDSEQSRRLISRAGKQNKHVIPVLLGEAPAAPMLFPMYSPGDESEAMTYLSEAARAWRFTPGAISWLRRVAAEVADRKKKKPKATGPSAATKAQLRKRSQEYGEVWQAGIHQVNSWLTSGGQPIRPWSFLVVNHSNHKILLQEIVPFPPSADQIWDFVCQAVNSPAYGKPHRPSEIQVREEAAWESIRPHLEEVGIDCIYRAELEEFDFLVRDLDRYMEDSDDTRRSIVNVPGMSAERSAALYAAATSYYLSAPWRSAADDLTIKVECPTLTAEPAFAVVMGNGGMTVGLALYRDLQSLHETRFPNYTEPGAIGRRISALTCLFGEPFEMAVPDLAAIESNQWEVAGPEAYPAFMSVHRESGPAVPVLRELELVEMSLRTVPQFVERCRFLEPYSERLTVSLGGRKHGVTLSWDPSVDSPCGDACTGHCEH